MTLRAFQCFAAGTHVDMHGTTVTVTPLQLKMIASAYDPKRRPAPLLLGHPRDESGAKSYGTVQALIAHDAALYAMADVGDELVRLVRDGKYKHVSASFDPPSANGNPHETLYLRHVGFLGSTPPAVKGMQPIAFALPLTDRYAQRLEIDCLNFAAEGVSRTSPRMQLYQAARDLSAACNVPFIEAASRAERALNRT